MLLPETDEKNAHQLAERLRQNVKSETFSVSCSFGVSHFEEVDTPETFINRTDKALYEAKEQGRDQVVTQAE